VVPLSLYLRRGVPEDSIAGSQIGGATAPVPIRLLTLGMVILVAMTLATYVRSDLVTYVQDSLHLSAEVAFAAGIVNGLCACLASPLAGLLSDRFGRKPMMMASLVSLAVLSVPAFRLLNQAATVGVICTVTALLAIVGWSGNVACLAAVAESFPVSHRSAALGTLYAVAIALAGGSTQFMVQWLIHITGNPLAPAWYCTAALAIGAWATIAMPETAPLKTFQGVTGPRSARSMVSGLQPTARPPM
jgi:MFS family permease